MTQQNRYMAFAYSRYYPCGGMDDFIGAYGTYEEAAAAVEKWLVDDAYESRGDVLDTQSGAVFGFKYSDETVQKIGEKQVCPPILTT